MNTHNCPVTDKFFKKMVSELQDILVLLDAQDRTARLDFLRYRGKVIKQFNLDTFHKVLKEATGGLNVKGIYSGGDATV